MKSKPDPERDLGYRDARLRGLGRIVPLLVLGGAVVLTWVRERDGAAGWVVPPIGIQLIGTSGAGTGQVVPAVDSSIDPPFAQVRSAEIDPRLIIEARPDLDPRIVVSSPPGEAR